mgnify:CR=1 FL=1
MPSSATADVSHYPVRFLRGRTLGISRPRRFVGDLLAFAQRVPSVFFCLGLKPANKDRYPYLHQPDFDFNDDAIPLGVEAFCRLATC